MMLWFCVGSHWDSFFLRYVQVCCVEFDRKDINMNKLVATSLEGRFHVFDMRTQHPTKGFASVSEKVTNSVRCTILAFPERDSIPLKTTAVNANRTVLLQMSWSRSQSAHKGAANICFVLSWKINWSNVVRKVNIKFTNSNVQCSE